MVPRLGLNSRYILAICKVECDSYSSSRGPWRPVPRVELGANSHAFLPSLPLLSPLSDKPLLFSSSSTSCGSKYIFSLSGGLCFESVCLLSGSSLSQSWFCTQCISSPSTLFQVCIRRPRGQGHSSFVPPFRLTLTDILRVVQSTTNAHYSTILIPLCSILVARASELFYQKPS